MLARHESSVYFNVQLFFKRFIFGRVGFLHLQQAGATLCCGVQASQCGGFACSRAGALGTQASVAATPGL